MAKIRIHQGDARTVLAGLPAESAQTCVTSPPYFGLRDYGTGTWEGGNDPGCNHLAARKKGRADYGFSSACVVQTSNTSAGFSSYESECPQCGARRVDRQIGLEKTPDDYVQSLVAVFREVRRVLKSDGTLWLNLGDSYASSGVGGPISGKCTMQGGKGINPKHAQANFGRAPTPDGLKPKDLIGIPWRVAFALQADGWYLRSDIIWAKPNPMPESVTDRPTKAHEYLFLLAKAERYYYDADAIKEPFADERMGDPGKCDDRYSVGSGRFDTNAGRGWTRGRDGEVNGRNKRSVWTIPSRPYEEAHFATFPPDLIRPCVLAGSRPGDTVLDPFNGAGTTGVVAVQHGRRYVGVELNPKYIDMSLARIDTECGLLTLL